MPAAAEDAAVEVVGGGLVRDDAHARDLARLDGLVDHQIRHLEPVLAIERSQLQHDRLANPEADRSDVNLNLSAATWMTFSWVATSELAAARISPVLK